MALIKSIECSVEPLKSQRGETLGINDIYVNIEFNEIDGKTPSIVLTRHELLRSDGSKYTPSNDMIVPSAILARKTSLRYRLSKNEFNIEENSRFVFCYRLTSKVHEYMTEEFVFVDNKWELIKPTVDEST